MTTFFKKNLNNLGLSADSIMGKNKRYNTMGLTISIILTLLSIVIVTKAIINAYRVKGLINKIGNKQLIKFININITLGFIFVLGYFLFFSLLIAENFSEFVSSLPVNKVEDVFAGSLFLLSAVFVIIASVVTMEVGKLLSKLDSLRRLDSLTSIYNHAEIKKLIAKEFGRCIRYNRKATLVMIDINTFKILNDTYGHMAGDKVIIDFVATLRQVSRVDDMLGRMGGDEFIVIMPETDSINAIKFVIRLKETVRNREIKYNNKIIKYTVSAGIAELNPNKHLTYERWLTEVDIDLYRNKYENAAALIAN